MGATVVAAGVHIGLEAAPHDLRAHPKKKAKWGTPATEAAEVSFM